MTEIVGLTKLAIGTSSPTTILDVRSTDSYTQGLFQNNNATNPGHIIIRNESYNEQIQIRSRYDGEDNHIFTWNGSAMANLRLNTSMMLLGNGNVGIGNTNPTNNLHISGSGSSTVLMLENTETGANEWGFHSMGSVRTGRLEIQSQGGTDTIPFTIEKSCPSHTLYLNSVGNVGIGITAPLTKLEITGDASEYIKVYNQGTSGDRAGLIMCNDSANNLAGGDTPQWAGFIDWEVGNDNLFIGHYRNYVRNEYIILNSSGNVGIGNTNPSHKLDVGGNVFSNNGFYTPTYTSGGNYYFGAEYLTRIVAGMEIEHTTLTGNYSQKLHFRTHHFNVSEDRRMTIDEDGNVGIGTTNPNYILDIGQSYGNTNQASAKKLALYNNASDGSNFYGFGISPSLLNFYANCSATTEPQMVLKENGNVGIGYTDPQNKLEVLGDIKCGNSANTLTALDIEINSSFAYGIYIGGWSSGGVTAGNSTIEMSSNLHIDSPSSGSIGPGNIYLNYYNSGQSTYIRNRVDISDKRIKKDTLVVLKKQLTESNSSQYLTVTLRGIVNIKSTIRTYITDCSSLIADEVPYFYLKAQ